MAIFTQRHQSAEVATTTPISSSSNNNEDLKSLHAATQQQEPWPAKEQKQQHHRQKQHSSNNGSSNNSSNSSSNVVYFVHALWKIKRCVLKLLIRPDLFKRSTDHLSLLYILSDDQQRHQIRLWCHHYHYYFCGRIASTNRLAWSTIRGQQF